MIPLLKSRRITTLGAQRTWAAIFFGESSLDLATAKAGGQTSTVPMPTGENADPKAALDSAMKSLRLKVDPREHRIVTAVGCEDVLCQSLRLPTTEEGELKQMLDLQIDALTPLPLEDVVYSFEPIGKTDTETRVLVAVARKTAVNERVAALEAAGLEAEVVGVDALAVFRNLVRRAALPRDEKLNTFVLFSPTAANVIIHSHGDPIAIRSIVLGEGALASTEDQTALREELARTLVAAEAETTDCPLGGITFATWSERLRGEVEALAGSWGEPVDFLHNGSAPSPAVSLCTETATEDAVRLNLLPDEWRKRRKAARFRQTLIRGAISAGAVCLLAVLVFLTMVAIRQTQLSRVDTQIKALRPKFGEARQLHKLLVEMQRQIDPKFSSIEVLREVSLLMPENLKLNSFDFKKDATLKLRGQTASAAMATEFISRLEKCELFSKVQTVGMRADPGGGGLTKFDVVCNLKSGAVAPTTGPSWR